MLNQIFNEDCLEGMKRIPDWTIDCIITDPPYWSTACRWDHVIPFDKMWEQLKRIIKPNGAIVLFWSEPFSSALRMSNIKMYRYDWIWNKKKAANFLFWNKQPLKKHEIVSVFYKSQPTYNPEKKVNPNGIQKSWRNWIWNTIHEHLPNCPEQSKAWKSYESDKLLPDTFLEFSKPNKPIHPTQKPVALIEYLIKTYTNEWETVLDFTIGSWTTAIAALNTNRNYIGFEMDKWYFDIAQERITKHLWSI